MGKLMDYANQYDVPEEQSGAPSLPTGKWLLLVTPSADSNGAAQVIETSTGKAVFKVSPLICGAEDGVPESVGGLTVFNQSFWPESYEKPGTLAPRFVGLLNTLFAPGVGLDLPRGPERSAARWKRTLAVLDAVAERNDLNPESYPSFPVFLAACAVMALRENRASFLARLKPGKGDRADWPDISSFEDDIPANREKRKIQVLVPQLDVTNDNDDEIPF